MQTETILSKRKFVCSNAELPSCLKWSAPVQWGWVSAISGNFSFNSYVTPWAEFIRG
jgi:hypothetical protein